MTFNAEIDAIELEKYEQLPSGIRAALAAVVRPSQQRPTIKIP